jgi:hypothetical protein
MYEHDLADTEERARSGFAELDRPVQPVFELDRRFGDV